MRFITAIVIGLCLCALSGTPARSDPDPDRSAPWWGYFETLRQQQVEDHATIKDLVARVSALEDQLDRINATVPPLDATTTPASAPTPKPPRPIRQSEPESQPAIEQSPQPDQAPQKRPVIQPSQTESPSSGGSVYVPGYYRKNGTYVKGYWRRK